MVPTEGDVPVCVSPPGHPPASLCALTSNLGTWDGCFQPQMDLGRRKELSLSHPDHIQNGLAADAAAEVRWWAFTCVFPFESFCTRAAKVKLGEAMLPDPLRGLAGAGGCPTEHTAMLRAMGSTMPVELWPGRSWSSKSRQSLKAVPNPGLCQGAPLVEG